MVEATLMNFKKNYKMSEFITSIVSLVVTGAMLRAGLDWITFSFLSCGIIALYIISRGNFKRNRTAVMYDGFKTSEFYALSVGVVGFSGLFLTHKIDATTATICIGILQGSFTHSRGLAKSLPGTTKVTILP